MPILSILFLTNCSSVKKLEISSVAVERVPLVLPEVDRIKLESIDWYIVNKDNLDSVLAELDKKLKQPACFITGTLDPVNFFIAQQSLISAESIMWSSEFKKVLIVKKSVENNKKVNDKIEKHNENVEIEGKKSFTSKLGDGIKKIF